MFSECSGGVILTNELKTLIGLSLFISLVVMFFYNQLKYSAQAVNKRIVKAKKELPSVQARRVKIKKLFFASRISGHRGHPHDERDNYNSHTWSHPYKVTYEYCIGEKKHKRVLRVFGEEKNPPNIPMYIDVYYFPANPNKVIHHYQGSLNKTYWGCRLGFLVMVIAMIILWNVK